MFWLISPWEAVRRSLEAQRQLMAFPWIFMPSGRPYQELADDKEDLSEAPPTPARSMATASPAAIPARRAMESIKGPVGARAKGKKSKRKNKSRKK
jgi:hypothetical protein